MARRREAKAALAPEEAVRFKDAMPMAAAPPPPPAAAKVNDNAAADALARVSVSGSRLSVTDLFRYPDDAIPQAGSSMPAWRWQPPTLSWAGPLLPADRSEERRVGTS